MVYSSGKCFCSHNRIAFDFIRNSETVFVRYAGLFLIFEGKEIDFNDLKIEY